MEDHWQRKNSFKTLTAGDGLLSAESPVGRMNDEEPDLGEFLVIQRFIYMVNLG